MTETQITRWRRRRPAFVTAGLLLLAPATSGLHSLYPTAPVWMLASVALIPSLIVSERCVALADRFGWLRVAIPRSGRRLPSSAYSLPRWVYSVESVAGGAIAVWFGIPASDHWRHIYPAVPAWMPFVTMVVLFGIATGIVEDAVNALLKRAWGQAPDVPVHEGVTGLDGTRSE